MYSNDNLTLNFVTYFHSHLLDQFPISVCSNNYFFAPFMIALPILRLRPCLVMGMPVVRAIFCLALFFYAERTRAFG